MGDCTLVKCISREVKNISQQSEIGFPNGIYKAPGGLRAAVAREGGSVKKRLAKGRREPTKRIVKR